MPVPPQLGQSINPVPPHLRHAIGNPPKIEKQDKSNCIDGLAGVQRDFGRRAAKERCNVTTSKRGNALTL
jgi:hypothetical protein